MNKHCKSAIRKLEDKLNYDDNTEISNDELIALLSYIDFLKSNIKYQSLRNSRQRIANSKLQKDKDNLMNIINRVKEKCNQEINASTHHLENHKSQMELNHKVAHERILNILNNYKEGK